MNRSRVLPTDSGRSLRFAGRLAHYFAGVVAGVTWLAGDGHARTLLGYGGAVALYLAGNLLDDAARQSRKGAGSAGTAWTGQPAQPGQLVPCCLCRQRIAVAGDELCATCRALVGGRPFDQLDVEASWSRPTWAAS